MPERNIILRLESVVSGSVGRAFNAVRQDISGVESGLRVAAGRSATLTADARQLAGAADTAKAAYDRVGGGISGLGAVGRRIFTAIRTDVGRLEEEFADSRREVSRLTRELKDLTAAGQDVTDITRRLEAAKERAGAFRREVALAKERLDDLAATRQRLDGIGNAFGKLSIASGVFSAAVSFGLHEVVEQYAEISEASNRASLTIERGSRLIMAAQRAGIRDATGFIEELKEIPRALNEVAENADKLDAFRSLGLDPQSLLGADPVERFLRIGNAVRSVGRDQRQYLLETAGLTGTLADQYLHLANLSETAWAEFVNGAREGRAITDEQAQALQAAQHAMAEFRQSLLLGGAEIITQYLPAIREVILGLANIAGGVLQFIADNQGLVTAFATATIAAATATAAYKGMAFAIGLVKTAQTALAATSVLSWSNPLIAAFAAAAVAIAGVVWFLRRLKGATEDANRTRLQAPDLGGLAPYGGVAASGAVARQEAAIRRQGANAAAGVTAGTAAAQPVTAALPPPTAAASTGRQVSIVNHIRIEVNAAFGDAAAAGEEVGNALAQALRAKLDASVWSR